MDKKFLEFEFDNACSQIANQKGFLTVKTALFEERDKRSFYFNVMVTDSSVHTNDVIKVKVWKYRGWKYLLSKHYHGSNQATPYFSDTENVPHKGIEVAFHYAANTLLSFIEKNDRKKNRWIEAKSFS